MRATDAHRHTIAWLVILAGISAALHVGKLPPAIPVLRDQLGVTLVQAGFLLSLVQLAGMLLGVAVGLGSDSIGLKRSMVSGLVLLSCSSVLGAFASTPAWLMALRALEGLGFLLAVMPAPGLIRRHTPASLLPSRLGWWGTYMPVGSALALLVGPWVMRWLDWSGWWLFLGGLSLAAAVVLMGWVPADEQGSGRACSRDPGLTPWPKRLRLVLCSAGPWWVALCFALYSSQWLSVVGFMPTIGAQLGLGPELAGALTASVALVNVSGNIASGRLLQAGWPARRSLWLGFICMSVGALLAFSPLTPGWRYGGMLLFSTMGGLIPGTLFSMAVRLAPSEATVSSTVGWMQQLSSLGQFMGPPLVAWVAACANGWHFTGLICTLGCGLGAGLAWRIQQALERKESRHD